MGIIVDLIIIICILVCMFLGYKKGLTGSLIKLLSFAIAVVVALVFYKPLAKVVMEKTVIADNIHTAIVETLDKSDSSSEKETKKETTNFIQNIENSIQEQAEEAKSEIIEQTATQATQTVVNVGSLLVLFIGARIALVIVSIFAKQVTKLPIIKQVDKTGGIIYGLAEGVLILYIIFAIISIVGVVNAESEVIKAISESHIGNLIYNNNLILKMFL